MPKVMNKHGIVSIVSEKRAKEMVDDDGATLLNEPDALPTDPVENRLSRGGISKPTREEAQPIAAAKESTEEAAEAARIEREEQAAQAAEAAKAAKAAAKAAKAGK